MGPAYDFLSTLAYVQGSESMGLVGSKRFAEVDEARFIRLAEKADLPPEIVRAAAHDAAWSELRD